MGKDHRKGRAVSDAQRSAFGMGVLDGRREARPLSDYTQPGDEEKRMRLIRQEIEDRQLARELGVPYEELQQLLS
jgi:hypothetical protein